MAIRAAITISATSFLLGMCTVACNTLFPVRSDPVCLFVVKTGLLFTHWIADSLTLWKTPVTDAHLWVAARYYHVLTKGAPGVGYVVVAAATLGAATILWSLRDGEAGNLMFDGGSICEFSPSPFCKSHRPCLLILTAQISPVQYRHCRLCTVCASQYVHSPALFLGLAYISRTCSTSGIFTNYVVLPPDHPGARFPPDLRAPTLGIASSHLICSVALTGVLALQTGRWWAERADDDANAAEELSASGRGSGEKEDSKPGLKKTAQGDGAEGLATVST